jgi:hypothetical protein
MKINRLENFFDNQTDFGFYGFEIFELNTEEIYFQNLIRSDILSDENNIGEFGPFKIDMLSVDDFEKINYTELNKILKEYYQDENWGSDLKIFKANVIKALDYLKIEKDEINYINLDKVRTELKPDYNFWSYFVGIISINRIDKKITKLYFGLD